MLASNTSRPDAAWSACTLQTSTDHAAGSTPAAPPRSAAAAAAAADGNAEVVPTPPVFVRFQEHMPCALQSRRHHSQLVPHFGGHRFFASAAALLAMRLA